MKIYFSGSIRGGREDVALYAELITVLQSYGTVLTEHLGDAALTGFGETARTDAQIYERDMAWVREADVVVAEVTRPSLGVGYEIAQAERDGTPILCLFRVLEGKRVSAMIAGSPNLTCREYETVEGAKEHFAAFFEGKREK